jgi:DNA polymerase III sliding clamp (beta) subunit (PCNA family)
MGTLTKKQEGIISKVVNSETIAKDWLKTPFKTTNGILACDGYRVLSKSINASEVSGDYKYVTRFLEQDDKLKVVDIKLKRTEVIKAITGTKNDVIVLTSTGSKFEIINIVQNKVLYETEFKGKKCYIGINAKYLRDALNFISSKEVEISFGNKISQITFLAPEYNCMVLPIRLCNKEWIANVENR